MFSFSDPSALGSSYSCSVPNSTAILLTFGTNPNIALKNLTYTIKQTIATYNEGILSNDLITCLPTPAPNFSPSATITTPAQISIGAALQLKASSMASGNVLHLLYTYNWQLLNINPANSTHFALAQSTITAIGENISVNTAAFLHGCHYVFQFTITNMADVSQSYQYDLVAIHSPISPTSYEYINNWASILVSFGYNIGLSNAACSTILQAITKYGVAPICAVTSSTKLLITFGSSPSIYPLTDAVNINANTIYDSISTYYNAALIFVPSPGLLIPVPALDFTVNNTNPMSGQPVSFIVSGQSSGHAIHSRYVITYDIIAIAPFSSTINASLTTGLSALTSNGGVVSISSIHSLTVITISAKIENNFGNSVIKTITLNLIGSSKPILQSAQYQSNWDKIVFSYDVDVTITEQCSTLFSSQLIASLGSGAQCKIASSNKFEVLLGDSPNYSPITTQFCILANAVSSSSAYADPYCILPTPLSPLPVPSFYFSKSEFEGDRISSLVQKYTSSNHNSGNTRFSRIEMQWQILNDNNTVQESLQSSILSQSSQYYKTINTSYMGSSQAYTIKARVVNLFGVTATEVFNVDLSALLISFRSVQGCQIIYITAYVINARLGGESIWSSNDITLLDKRIALTSIDSSAILINTTTFTAIKLIAYTYKALGSTISAQYTIQIPTVPSEDLETIYEHQYELLTLYSSTPQTYYNAKVKVYQYSQYCYDTKYVNPTIIPIHDSIESVTKSDELVIFFRTKEYDCNDAVYRIRKILYSIQNVYEYYNIIIATETIIAKCNDTVGYLLDDTWSSVNYAFNNKITTVDREICKLLIKSVLSYEKAFKRDIFNVLMNVSDKCIKYNELPLSVKTDESDYYYYKYFGTDNFAHMFTSYDTIWDSVQTIADLPNLSYTARDKRDARLDITFPYISEYNYSSHPEDNYKVGHKIGILIRNGTTISVQTYAIKGDLETNIKYSVLFPTVVPVEKTFTCQLNQVRLYLPTYQYANLTYKSTVSLSPYYPIMSVSQSSSATPNYYVLCNYSNGGLLLASYIKKLNASSVFNLQVIWVFICFILMLAMGVFLNKKDSMEKETSIKQEQYDKCLKLTFKEAYAATDQASMYFTPNKSIHNGQRNSNSTIECEESISSRGLVKVPSAASLSPSKNVSYKLNGIKSFMRLYYYSCLPFSSFILWYSPVLKRLSRVICHFSKMSLMLTACTLIKKEYFVIDWKFANVFSSSATTIICVLLVYSVGIIPSLVNWHKLFKSHSKSKQLNESLSDKMQDIVSRYIVMSNRAVKKVKPFGKEKQSRLKTVIFNLNCTFVILIPIIALSISIYSSVLLSYYMENSINVALLINILMILVTEYGIAPLLKCLLLYVMLLKGSKCFNKVEFMLRYNGISFC